jgi:hypothetical protein
MPIFGAQSVFVLGRTPPAILSQKVNEGDSLYWDSVQGVFVNKKALATDGSGMINLSNTGTGDPLASVSGNTLKEKSLAAGTNITLFDDGQTITISSSAATSGYVSVVYRTLDFTSGTTDLVTLPSSAIILSTEIAVLSAFDGTPTLTIGTPATHDLLIENDDIDLTASTSFKEDASFILPNTGVQDLKSYLVANGATHGQFSVFIEYFVG